MTDTFLRRLCLVISFRAALSCQLGVIGLCQICFGATFHAYEHFSDRVHTGRWAKRRHGRSERTHFAKDRQRSKAAEFGEDVADFCLTHERVQLARTVRNALAYDGGRVARYMFGKVPPDVAKKLTEKLHEEFFVEDGEIRIVAANNLNLFEILKVRVSKLVAKAVTLPQFVR